MKKREIFYGVGGWAKYYLRGHVTKTRQGSAINFCKQNAFFK